MSVVYDETVALKSDVDAWVDEATPGANHPDSAKLRLNGGGGGDDRRAYVFFGRPFPLHAVVLSAKLRLHLAGAWASSQTLTAKRVTVQWREHVINWTNKPTTSSTNSAGAGVTGGSDQQLVELDVTAMLNDVANGSAWHGLELSLSASVARALYSSDHPTAWLRPKLIVEWRERPEPPDALKPSGGDAVSPTKPVLDWVFGDAYTKAAQGQSAFQVQISSTTDFSSPLFDSGKTSSEQTSLDLATTTFGGISSGQTRYWRVRAWDDTDLVSDWSVTASFTRVAKGTLTIDNPAAPPNNFVEELTPPLAWTLSGATQAAFELVLYQLDAGGTPTEIYRWSRRASTATSVTVPAVPSYGGYSPESGTLLHTGGSYRMRLRVWDDVDRASTPGDPPYVEATRDFTYSRSGTPAAVTSFTATPSGAAVILEWHRATMPDYWALKVDGVEVLARIDPDDVFVTGTTYRMTYWGAKPRAVVEYEIEAVVMTTGKLKHSGGNATADAKTQPLGHWLVDPDDDTAVNIVGEGDVELNIRKVGETVDVPGRRAPVRINDIIGGYIGSVSGEVIDRTDGSRTAQEQRDDYETLVGRDKVLRLILGDLNIPIELEDTSTRPTGIPGDQLYEIGFQFFQRDEWTFDVIGG